jgi:hypothetical protein
MVAGSRSGSSFAGKKESHLMPRSVTEEALDKRVRRPGQHPLGCVELHQLAAYLHHRNAIPEPHRLVDVMGDEDDGLVQLGLEVQELLLQLAADDRINGAERFVHQEQRGVGRQGPRHAHPLLLAPRELIRVPLGHRGRQSDQVHQLLRPLAGLGPGRSEQAGDRGDVLDDRAMREEAALLDDVADHAAQPGGVRRRTSVPSMLTVPEVGLDETVDHPKRRGLAASRRADQHRDLPGGALEGEVVDCQRAVVVAFRDVIEGDHRTLSTAGGTAIVPA